MKKLLLSVLSVLALSVSVNAQTWNFSDTQWTTASADAIKGGTTIDALTNYSANAKASVGASSKKYTLNGTDYIFTHTFKFGETGSFEDATPVTGVLSFEVTGNSTISVVGTHASSSGPARELVVAAKDGDTLKELGSFLVYQKSDTEAPAGMAGALDSGTYTYEGDATTIYVYSRTGGVNLYLVESVAGGTSGINDAAADKGVVVAAEYYDITGRKVSEKATGLIMKKLTYENGTTEVVKTVVRK